MRPMTPTEYADAYRYWKEQDNRQSRAQVEDLIDARTVHLYADIARLAARGRWPESDEVRRQRQLVLMSENPGGRVA